MKHYRKSTITLTVMALVLIIYVGASSALLVTLII